MSSGNTQEAKMDADTRLEEDKEAWRGKDEFVAPAQNYRFVRKFIPRFLQPFLRSVRKRVFNKDRPKEEPFRTVFPYTGVHPIRQTNLLSLAQHVDSCGIPGAIVECGVLDGGAAALMAFGTEKSSREVHLFDSWQGLPDPTEKDSAAAKVWAGELVGSERRVRSVMRKLNINPTRLFFHKGWFDQTFPQAHIDSIALLHVDADFYEPVRLCIDTWYPKLSPGGYVQFDDYLAFIGCRRAVDEFLAVHPELKLQNKDGMAFFIKKPDTTEQALVAPSTA
jgi:O-methyltransferase